jgi:hypothetical protein
MTAKTQPPDLARVAAIIGQPTRTAMLDGSQQKQPSGAGSIEPALTQSSKSRLHRSSSGKGVIDDKQADEQHKQLPVDTAEHFPRSHFS